MVIGMSAISWQGCGPEDKVGRVRSCRRVLPSGLIPSGPREFPVCPAVVRSRGIRLCPIPSRPQASKSRSAALGLTGSRPLWPHSGANLKRRPPILKPCFGEARKSIRTGSSGRDFIWSSMARIRIVHGGDRLDFPNLYPARRGRGPSSLLPDTAAPRSGASFTPGGRFCV